MVPPDSQGLGGGTIILGLAEELVLLLSPISRELAFAAEMLLDVADEVVANSPPKQQDFFGDLLLKTIKIITNK